jgi:hypothetical protein
MSGGVSVENGTSGAAAQPAKISARRAALADIVRCETPIGSDSDRIASGRGIVRRQ